MGVNSSEDGELGADASDRGLFLPTSESSMEDFDFTKCAPKAVAPYLFRLAKDQPYLPSGHRADP